ncbi:hypothetical protein [Streptomyces sp. HNM0574]|uniref:hypothetical protein n=1 Tax=Streptomyces sp. HNM0574 TaxID=2714954 RepID=UPI00146A1B65|nr:hypothetical protein [Streptomyces sp. HNM0574]NLU67737.1 hypothetical protein [Streptomyces sp. HNM0574]
MKRPSVRKLAVLGAVVAAAVAVLALRAGGPADSPAPSGPGSGTSSSDVQQDPGSAEDYWTPERRASAEPAPMPGE